MNDVRFVVRSNLLIWFCKTSMKYNVFFGTSMVIDQEYTQSEAWRAYVHVYISVPGDGATLRGNRKSPSNEETSK